MPTQDRNNKMTRPGGNRERVVSDQKETLQMSNVFELTARRDSSAAELPLTPEFLAALAAPPQKVPALCTVTWCVLDRHHAYDSVIAGSGELTRFHESGDQAFGECPSPVLVAAYEAVYDRAAPTIDAPKVSIVNDLSGADLNAQQAWDLGEALMRAAVLLKQIQGGK